MKSKEKSKRLADALFPDNRDEEIFDVLSIPPEQRRLHTETYDFTVSTILDQLRAKRIVIPEYQRNYVWSVPQASRLIESLIIQCPIPTIYLSQGSDEVLSVIDGNQRLMTLSEFISEDSFDLKGLTVYPQLDGLRFSGLDSRFQRHILNRALRCLVILKETHPQIKFDVFERLNTGAAKLTPQELRHGLYHGKLIRLASSLSKAKEFKKLLPAGYEKRQKSEELCLRFFATYYNGDNYQKPLASFINSFVEDNRGLQSGIDEDDLSELFNNAVSRVSDVFGELSFKIFHKDGRIRSGFNAALFDAEMLGVSRISSKKYEALKKNKKKLISEISGLFEDEKFLKSISQATSDEQQFAYRVSTFSSAIDKVVG